MSQGPVKHIRVVTDETHPVRIDVLAHAIVAVNEACQNFQKLGLTRWKMTRLIQQSMGNKKIPQKHIQAVLEAVPVLAEVYLGGEACREAEADMRGMLFLNFRKSTLIPSSNG